MGEFEQASSAPKKEQPAMDLSRDKNAEEMKSLKQGYNIVFLWNKKEQVEGVEFHKIHKEIREIFEEANLIEKV